MHQKLNKYPLALAIETIDFPHEIALIKRRQPPSSFSAGLSISAFMLAASASSWAQTTLPEVTVTTDRSSKETLQTNQTSIGKGTQDIRDIPQSITVMTEKLMDEAKLTTLKEALHYTSGITFAAAENGTDQDIRLRGFPVATTGDLLLDGMRDPSQYDRDAFNYDRIEVMRGSASMLFGRGSTGGVINQVSKKSFLDDHNEIDTTLGTGRYFRLTGDFNIRTGNDSALRMNVMRNTADNKGAEINKYGIAPTFSWGIGHRDEFSVGLFYLNVDNVPMSGIRYLNGTVPDIKPGNFYGTKSDYQRGEATYLSASHKHRFDDGGQLHSQIRSGRFNRSQWSTTASFAKGTTPENLNGATVLTRSGLAPRKDSYTGTYLQSDYSNKYNAFGVKHELIGGVDAAYEKADRFGGWGGVGTNYNKGNTTVGTPNDGRSLPVEPMYRDISNYSFKSFGLYVQDLVQIAPDWKLLGGIRFDSFKGDFDQIAYLNATTNMSNKTTSTSLSDSMFSYRTGVLYQPSATSSYHLSYGTSFNTSADTYQYVTQQTANTPPEKSRNIELGAKLDWMDGNLSTRGALFQTEKYNERTTDSDFAGDAYTLSGKRHSRGMEIDIVGKLTPKTEVYFSYTNIWDASIDKAGSAANAQASVGKRVGLTPKQSAALWLSYQAMPKLRVAGGVHGASENFALSGQTGAAYANARAPGYAVADLMLEYTIDPRWTAQLNVNNAFNRRYGDQLYPGFVVLGAPRTFLLTVATRF
ncbi:TonB-dependent receptor [Solimicrobium silvestre]|uniref:TonB-siderophor: TonB-dependent siderophore receptor n=1 Tax=Solimicrobium silvestre TaxID=2099400 RepID=A0A2S9GVX2_9BURK|nr:TonB-dependent siderophore receptor [Solimicrobium silvestre]PRC91872.1 TonB-siderophor: TonB-dependent siderophore receptor [Solimicrobium silvestre]